MVYLERNKIRSLILPWVFLVLGCHMMFGADAPIAEEDRGAQTQRINAYFANIPDYEFPCGDIELVYHEDMVEALDQKVRFDFQSIRRRGGTFEKAKQAVEEARQNLRKAHEDRLFSALDAYLLEREYEKSTARKNAEALFEATNNRVDEQYLLFMAVASQTWMANRTYQAEVKKYYDFVVKAFDGLDESLQKSILADFETRIDCLRKERMAVYKELMESTILLEKGFNEYLNGEFKENKVERWDQNKIDEINEQLKRVSLQLKYQWLVPEFSNQVATYKAMLWAHDKKLRNTKLLPLIKQAQKEEPLALPTEAFKANQERFNVRQEIARLRARICYLTLLEDEAKVEGLYSVNTSPMDRLVSTYTQLAQKDKELKDLEAWVASEGTFSKAHFDSVLMKLAIGKQLTGNVLDQFIMTPMKDKGIELLQSLGIFDGGWKTSTVDNFEKYNQSIVHLGPKIKLMQGWAEKEEEGPDENRRKDELTYDIGQNYITAIGNGSSPQLISDLLGDYDFASRTRGGIANILEILCDDPQMLKALWFQSTKIIYESRLLDGRNRLATARGAEPLSDPDKAIAMADLQLGVLGPVDEKADVLFEFPAIVKNFFGQNLGDFGSQDNYMKKLLDTRLILTRTIDDLAQSTYNYNPDRLASKSVVAYLDHVYLESRYVDYANALLKIKTAEWERTKVYISEATKAGNYDFETTTRLTPGNQVALATAQQTAERELLELNVRLAYLKLEYFAYTANYKAAAAQVVEWAKLGNQLRKKKGQSGVYNVKNVELEFKAKALAMETVAIYEGLLNEAILTLITSGITSKVQESLLGTSESLSLWESVVKNQNAIATKLLQTAFPAHQLFSVEGIVGMVEGTAWTLVKEKIAFEAAQMANSASGNANAWDQADFQAVVDNVFDNTKDLLEVAYPVAREAVMERSVAWYAYEAEADMKLKAANEARAEVDQKITKALADTDNHLESLEWSKMTKDQREEALNTVDDRLKGPLADVGVQRALSQLSKAQEELDSIVKKKDERVDKLKRYSGYLSLIEELETRARDRIDKTVSNLQSAQAQDPAYIKAKAETWKRIVFNKHAIRDLENLVETDDPASLRQHLLTPNCDIKVLRDAFGASIKQAEANNDAAEVERIRAIAAEVDDIRIDTINTILDEFLSESEFGKEVALVIQGGAAKGNPEYQGLFADIDFTLMVHEESNVDQGALKQAMLDYFEQKGFVLASKDIDSSMDSEGFVQKLGKFDSRKATKKDIVEDLIEKGVDPTRFYTEGGTVWFINNAAYSGKLLWPKSGQGVKWVNVPQDFGHDLAVDMTRYLGFLNSPKYTENYLQGKPIEYQMETLEAALGKTKYFIRLVDAYEIGHEQGNKIYNSRIDRKQESGEDASYHLQIYKDAVEMVKQQDPNDPRNVITEADLPMIKRIAEMKMKGDFSSPWKVLEKEGFKGEAAIAEAHKTMEWMRTSGPKMLAKLSGDFHRGIEARAKHEDSEVRNEAFASAMRMMSVNRNIMMLDSPDAAPLIASKMKDGKVMTDAEHAEEIAKNIRIANQGKHIAQELAPELVALTDEELEGAGTKAKVDAILKGQEADINDIPASELAIFKYENLLKPSFDYMRHVAELID